MGSPGSGTSVGGTTVAELGDADVPADRGLSALGLIMQLAGWIFGTAIGGSMLITLLTLLMLGGQVARGGELLWIAIIAAASITRSVYHVRAGRELLYSTSPFAGVRLYLKVAAAHTLLMAGIFTFKFDAPFSLFVSAILVLGAWPITLAVMLTRPAMRALDGNALPETPDRGFEGISILMAILGMVGLGFGLLLLYSLLSVPSGLKSASPVVMSLLTAAALVVRSALHVRAGWVGLSAAADHDRVIQAANRYGSFGLISVFIAGGAAFLSMMSFGGGGFLLMIGYIALIGALLAAWPLIIRTFFSERQFQGLMANPQGGEVPQRRAHDMGLTALGWLLLGLAVMSLSTAVPTVLLGASSGGGMSASASPADFMSMAFASTGQSPWLNIGISGLQLWAAHSLIQMSPHHRIAATVYGAAASIVAVYLQWPALKSLGSFSANVARGKFFETMSYWGIAISLIVPVATVALVNRQRVALARARYR